MIQDLNAHVFQQHTFNPNQSNSETIMLTYYYKNKIQRYTKWTTKD